MVAIDEDFEIADQIAPKDGDKIFVKEICWLSFYGCSKGVGIRIFYGTGKYFVDSFVTIVINYYY